MAIDRFQNASAGRNLDEVSSFHIARRHISLRLNHEGLKLAERPVNSRQHAVN